jgi:hypothetical protein
LKSYIKPTDPIQNMTNNRDAIHENNAPSAILEERNAASDAAVTHNLADLEWDEIFSEEQSALRASAPDDPLAPLNTEVTTDLWLPSISDLLLYAEPLSDSPNASVDHDGRVYDDINLQDQFFATAISRNLRGRPAGPAHSRKKTPDATPLAYTQRSGTNLEISRCRHVGCHAVFTGVYRRNTMLRHCRLRHGNHDEEEKHTVYSCYIPSCEKTFARQDAMLKHMRKQHPYLGLEKTVPRKAERSSKRHSVVAPRITQMQDSVDVATFPFGLDSVEPRLLFAQDHASINATVPLPRPSGLPVEAQLPHKHTQAALQMSLTSPETDPTHHNHIGTEDHISLRCSLCDVPFQRMADLRRHTRKHEEPQHICPVQGCDRKFYRPDKLTEHLERGHKAVCGPSHEGARQIEQRTSFTCEQCISIFTSIGQRNAHYNSQHTRRFQCGSCEKAFGLKTDLHRHENAVHNTQQTFACIHCLRNYARRDNMLRHERSCQKRREAGT